MNKTKPQRTRADYMTHRKIAHGPYYRFIAHETGAFEYLHGTLTRAQIATIQAALSGGDVHLNNIESMPLSWWDVHAHALRAGFAVAERDGRIDEHWSLSSGVCALKNAAIAIILNIKDHASEQQRETQ